MSAADEVEALLEPYESFLRDERMRGKDTVSRYVSILRAFCSFVRCSHTDAAFDAITHREIASFLRERATSSGKPSPTAWNLTLSALRAFYGFLNRTEVLSVNPTLKIERHKVSSRERVPFSLKEYLALVKAAKATSNARRNVAIVEVLFHTGLRVRELVSLGVDQVDWQAYAFRDVRTKGKGWRSPEFNDVVSEALGAYLRERGMERPLAGGALFLSRRGTRLSVRSVETIVSALGKAAGIARPVTPHLFRHSCASALHQGGTPLRVVQSVCGHKSIATTQIYVHSSQDARRQAIDALGKRVEEARRALSAA